MFPVTCGGITGLGMHISPNQLLDSHPGLLIPFFYEQWRKIRTSSLKYFTRSCVCVFNSAWVRSVNLCSLRYRYTAEVAISRMHRDMRLLSIGAGADEVMLSIICKLSGTLPK